MKFKFILIASLTLTSCNSVDREDIVFDDFENKTYKNWDIQGVSFKKPVHIDSLILNTSNVHGKYLACSNFPNDGKIWGQGKLVSKDFVINRNYINFLIAGGNNTMRECVNLIVDNEIVRSSSGKNDTKLRQITWDVREFEGKKSSIEIVDAIVPEVEAGSFGYVLVDNIVFSDNSNPREIVFEDFESGTYSNWEVVGDAFLTPRDRKNVYYPLSVNGFNGKYFALSFGDAYDKKIGKLISKPFIIKNDFIKCLVGGGKHDGETCINLIVNDSIVFSATGENDGYLREHSWNVKAFKNQYGRLEILDENSGHWGHVMVDDIIFYNSSPLLSKTIITITILVLSLIIIVFVKYYGKTKKVKVELDIEDYDKLESLKKIIKDSKAYTNTNYSINDVALISNLEALEIESLFEKSEYDSLANYINYLRVELFKEQINNPENSHYTMVSIAENCGFSSRASFYRIFKKITNITPSEYKKKTKQD